MATIVHLDEIPGINVNSTADKFVHSLTEAKLPKGTFFSGTVHFQSLPGNLVQAEIQGVVGYIGSDILLDMTLTSVDHPTRWTCSLRGNRPVKWVERH